MAILRDRNKTWTFDGRMSDGHAGWVYAVQPAAGGPIKIGFAADPVVRMAKLQAMSPVALCMRGIVRGSIEVERRMHESLAAYRLHGEWFADADDVKAAIAHFEPFDEASFQAKRQEQRSAAKAYVRREIAPDPRRRSKPARGQISYDLTADQEDERMARLRIAARALDV